MALIKLSELRDTSVTVYITIMLFSMSSWIDINGVWTELPLLVKTLPEGWTLPSYLVVAIQVGNIGPLLYTLANRLAPKRVVEWPVVYVILLVGGISCILLVFFWSRTTVIGSTEYSAHLIGLATLLAIVDCTSSVVYLPYMAYLKPQYMTAFYVGESFSGLVPGVLGLIQGAGGDPKCTNTTILNETSNITDWEISPTYSDPRFSVEVYFFCLFALFIISTAAFTLLHFVPWFHSARLPHVDDIVMAATDDKAENFDTGRKIPEDEENSSNNTDVLLKAGEIELKETKETCDDKKNSSFESKAKLSVATYLLLLVVIGWKDGLTNAVLPATQTYSCLPYGNFCLACQY